MQIEVNDFRYMWCGKQLEPLPQQQANLLAPIDIRQQGQNRALLLLHGFSSSPAVYRELLPKLPSYDAILCPTLPGHGESIMAFTKAKASDWLLAAEEICATLTKNYEKVDVMGLSLGGLLACHLSQRFPLHHLYLLAPALDLQLNPSKALRLAKFLDWLGFKYLRNRAGNLYSPLFRELAYRQLPLATIIEILTLINEFKFIPPAMPTDVFLGNFDMVVDSAAIEKKFLNVSHCRIHWLPKSAHVLPLDSDINIIIDCLKTNEKKS